MGQRPAGLSAPRARRVASGATRARVQRPERRRPQNAPRQRCEPAKAPPDQRPETASRRPQTTATMPNKRPQRLGSNQASTAHVAQRQQHAAAHALHEAAADQDADAGRECAHDAAAAIDQRRGDEHALDAKAQAGGTDRGAGDDGADFVERDGPVDVGDAAEILDDGRRDGGGDQRVRGNAARRRCTAGRSDSWRRDATRRRPRWSGPGCSRVAGHVGEPVPREFLARELEAEEFVACGCVASGLVAKGVAFVAFVAGGFGHCCSSGCMRGQCKGTTST